LIHLTFFHSQLLLADSVIELVLPHDVLEGVVANEEGAQLLFVKIDKPVDEAAIGPAAWLLAGAQEVAWATARRIRNNRLLFVRVDDLLVNTRRDLRMMPVIMASTTFGWDEELLHGVHECAKDQRGQHDEHERCRHHEIILLLCVAVGARFTGLAIPLDLED